MHRGVVGSKHDQTALHTCDGAVDKSVGTDIHAHMLHADQRPLAGIRHAEGGFHGCLLVGAPAAVNPTLACEGVALDVLRDFRRRRARISIDAGETSINGSLRNRLVA